MVSILFFLRVRRFQNDVMKVKCLLALCDRSSATIHLATIPQQLASKVCHVISLLTLIWYSHWQESRCTDYTLTPFEDNYAEKAAYHMILLLFNTFAIFSFLSVCLFCVSLRGLPSWLVALIGTLFHTYNLTLLWRTIFPRRDASAAQIPAWHYFFLTCSDIKMLLSCKCLLSAVCQLSPVANNARLNCADMAVEPLELETKMEFRI